LSPWGTPRRLTKTVECVLSFWSISEFFPFPPPPLSDVFFMSPYVVSSCLCPPRVLQNRHLLLGMKAFPLLRALATQCPLPHLLLLPGRTRRPSCNAPSSRFFSAFASLPTTFFLLLVMSPFSFLPARPSPPFSPTQSVLCTAAPMRADPLPLRLFPLFFFCPPPRKYS